MPYGFFDFAVGARQQDGFFIDEDNRILFWPTNGEPGFVLDEKTAVELAFGRRKSVQIGALLGGIASPLVMYGVALFTSVNYPFVESIFTTGGAVLGLVEAVVILFIVLALASKYFIEPRKRLCSRLQGMNEVITMPRPTPIIIKPADIMGGMRFSLFVLGIPLVGVLFGLMAFIEGSPVGDRLAVGSLSALMMAAPLKLLWNQLKGARASSIWLYQPITVAPPPPPSKAVGEGGRLRRFGRWASSGWRVWVLGLIAAIGGAIGYVEFEEVPLTSRELLDQYRQTAFPSQDDVVMKWTRPVTICVGPSKESDLRAGIESAIKATAEAGNLAIEWGGTGCAVSVAFLEAPRQTADGSPDPIGATFSHVGGALQGVQVEVSLASLGVLAPGAVFGNRHSRQRLVRNVSSTVALWSLGFRGIPNFEPAYEDRHGDRLPISHALSAIHYDKRVRAGGSAKETMAQAEVIAEAVLEGNRPGKRP